MDDAWGTLRPFLLPLAMVLGLMVIAILTTFRRARAVRDRALASLAADEEIRTHAQYLTDAQKTQAAAERATGQERLDGLRRAIALWRAAARTRQPDDHGMFEMLKANINLLEDELRAAGEEP